MDINFTLPKCCGDCKTKIQIGDKYICNYPVDKAHEILDISAYQVDIETRPDWCPLSKFIEKANQMSDEKKKLFNQMCDGMKAMFELLNNNREE